MRRGARERPFQLGQLLKHEKERERGDEWRCRRYDEKETIVNCLAMHDSRWMMEEKREGPRESRIHEQSNGRCVSLGVSSGLLSFRCSCDLLA